jgi:hypothetical protein
MNDELRTVFNSSFIIHHSPLITCTPSLTVGLPPLL